jgi:hypothetical protein
MTITDEGTITAQTNAEAVTDAWQVYRRSQLIPPGPPDLMNARSLLLRLLEPHTRTWGAPAPFLVTPDLDAIEDAADSLVAAVEWHYGTETAARVAGDHEGRVAA